MQQAAAASLTADQAGGTAQDTKAGKSVQNVRSTCSHLLPSTTIWWWNVV